MLCQYLLFQKNFSNPRTICMYCTGNLFFSSISTAPFMPTAPCYQLSCHYCYMTSYTCVFSFSFQPIMQFVESLGTKSAMVHFGHLFERPKSLAIFFPPLCLLIFLFKNDQIPFDCLIQTSYFSPLLSSFCLISFPLPLSF